MPRRAVLPPLSLIAPTPAQKLDLADRLHLLRSAGTVHRAAFVEDGRDDVVAGVDVGQELIEQVAIAEEVPDMMMRIDDRQVGLEIGSGAALASQAEVRPEDARQK